MLWSYGPCAAETPSSVYFTQLTEAAQRLRAAADRPDPATSKKLLLEVREHLPVQQTVENQGAGARADYTWLYDMLHAVETGAPPDKQKTLLTQAAARLEAIAARVKETERPAASGQAAREELQKILQRAEFKVVESSEDTGGITAWIRDVIRWISDKIFGAQGRPTRIPIIEALFGLALIALITLMVSYIRSAWYRPPSLGRGLMRPGTSAAVSEGSLPSLLTQALRYAEEGNYRWAIRFLYLALLTVFSQREWIHLDERKTNREYLNEIKTKATDAVALGLFARMTESFDRVWYGKQACTENQYREYLEHYQSIAKTIRSEQ